jgi:hypothetical protein
MTCVLMNDTPGGESQERGQGPEFKGDFHTFDPFHVPSSDTFHGDRCGCREKPDKCHLEVLSAKLSEASKRGPVSPLRPLWLSG